MKQRFGLNQQEEYYNWLAKQDENRTEAFIQAEQTQMAQRKKTVSYLVNLMSVLGNESKAFALVAIAISTTMEAIIAYQAGVAAAVLASKNQLEIGDPYTAAARAAAAYAGVMAWTVANVALIAAAGVARGVSVAGGGTGGSFGASTGTYAASPITGTPEEERRGNLTIIIEGDFIGDEAYIEMLAEKISEAVEDRNVRLIASNSRYAEALT